MKYCLFSESKSVVKTKRRYFIMFYGTKYFRSFEIFRQPRPGVSPSAILNPEKGMGKWLRKAKMAFEEKPQNFHIDDVTLSSALRK